MAKSLEPFFANVEEPMRGSGDVFGAHAASARSLSTVEFAQSIQDYLIGLAKQGIDTHAEREAIVAHILKGFDTFIAPRLGMIMSRVVRKAVKSMVEDALESLAELGS